MKRYIKSKLVVYLALVVMAVSVVSCGFLMYPERRGRTSGNIDPVVLVLDCLWLLAGVIPGVVALVVDFTTGGMYESGSALNVQPGNNIAFNLRGLAPAEANLTVIVLSGDGQETVATLFNQDFAPGEKLTEPVTFAIPSDLEPGAYKLAVKVNDNTSAHWTLNISH